MVGYKVERIIINHQKRRKTKKAPKGYVYDHILPVSLGGSHDEKNLQLIKKSIHKRKTIIDFIIMKELNKKGMTEKVTNYSKELISSKKKIEKYYFKRFKELNNNRQVGQVGQEGHIDYTHGNLTVKHIKTCPTCLKSLKIPPFSKQN